MTKKKKRERLENILNIVMAIIFMGGFFALGYGIYLTCTFNDGGGAAFFGLFLFICALFATLCYGNWKEAF